MNNGYLKKLFMIDGIGAIISAVSLGIVLVHFERFFGIPIPTLYFLAFIPCLFFVYDIYCYYFVKQKLNKYLLGIAYANLAYCILSLGFAFYHFELLQPLAWLYILGEVIIIVIIARIEIKASKAR